VGSHISSVHLNFPPFYFPARTWSFGRFRTIFENHSVSNPKQPQSRTQSNACVRVRMALALGNWQPEPLNLGVPVLCRHARLFNVKPITKHRKNSISPEHWNNRRRTERKEDWAVLYCIIFFNSKTNMSSSTEKYTIKHFDSPKTYLVLNPRT
jgi:hypothetical protein